MPWLSHQAYVDLCAKREEASDKREEARSKRDLKELIEAVEKLRKDIASLRGFLYRTGRADEEEADEGPPALAQPTPGGWR